MFKHDCSPPLPPQNSFIRMSLVSNMSKPSGQRLKIVKVVKPLLNLLQTDTSNTLF